MPGTQNDTTPQALTSLSGADAGQAGDTLGSAGAVTPTVPASPASSKGAWARYTIHLIGVDQVGLVDQTPCTVCDPDARVYCPTGERLRKEAGLPYDEHVEALERLRIAREEDSVKLDHLSALLASSDEERFKTEQALTILHNRFWTQLHEGGDCEVCAIGVPT